MISRRNIPNFLSIARLIFILLSLGALYQPLQILRWVGLGLICMGFITDFFDGYLARMWKTHSKLGSYLDSLTDKLAVFSALMVCIDLHLAPVWLVIAILIRDIVMTSFRDWALGQGISIPALFSGKVKATLQFVGIIILYFVAIGFPELQPIGYYALLFAMVIGYYGLYDTWKTHASRLHF